MLSTNAKLRYRCSPKLHIYPFLQSLPPPHSISTPVLCQHSTVACKHNRFHSTLLRICQRTTRFVQPLAQSQTVACKHNKFHTSAYASSRQKWYRCSLLSTYAKLFYIYLIRISVSETHRLSGLLMLFRAGMMVSARSTLAMPIVVSCANMRFGAKIAKARSLGCFSLFYPTVQTTPEWYGLPYILCPNYYIP